MVVTIGVNVYLLLKCRKAFSRSRTPAADRAGIQGQQHISFAALRDKATYFEQQVRTDPDIDTVDVVGRRRRWRRAKTRQMFVQLKPKPRSARRRPTK